MTVAADEKDTPGVDKPLPPLKLETLGDVGRALAQVTNEMRAGKCSKELGYAIGYCLATLAKVKADVRDSKHKREVAELHDLLVKKKQPEPRVQ